MATVNEKMTALADEIRELSGTTTSKSIDAMTSDVDAANTEIAEQTELLEQIATALEGKAGGGAEDLNTELTEQENLISQLSTILDSKASGSSGGGSVETCTVIINNPLTTYWLYSYTAYENSKIIGKTNIDVTGAGVGGNSLTLDNVICGSTVTIIEARGVSTNYSSSDDNTTQFLGSYATSGCIAFTAPTSSNVIATVTLGAYID